MSSQLQRPQSFELFIMTGKRRSLIKSTQVNTHRLKALAVELNEIQLLPENRDYSPIVVDLRDQEFSIEGLAVGVVRVGM